MKKLLMLLPGLCLALIASTGKADTLTFNNVPGGGDIGPYSLTLTAGSSTSGLLLFCMDDFTYIQSGESWGVNIINGASLISTLGTTLGKEYEEEAYIYSKYTGANATDVQLALWKIFDSSENITGDANAVSMVSAAANFSNAFYTDGALDGYSFYIYDGGPIHDQYGKYDPQDFIGLAGPTPTPEPSSLFLLGSGLLGLAGVARRKVSRS